MKFPADGFLASTTAAGGPVDGCHRVRLVGPREQLSAIRRGGIRARFRRPVCRRAYGASRCDACGFGIGFCPGAGEGSEKEISFEVVTH